MDVARLIITSVLLSLAAVFLAVELALGFTVGTVFLLANAGVALVLAGVWSVFRLGWWRTDERRRRLLVSGIRVRASLVSSRPTHTKVNDRRVLAHTFESRSAGRVIRAVVLCLDDLPVGTEATIAYDPVNPARATVVEDLAKRRTERVRGPRRFAPLEPRWPEQGRLN